MQVQPYLFFDGRCEEAIEFYKSALGARVEMLMRFKESPGSPASGHGAARQRGQGDARVPAHRRHRRDGVRWPLSGATELFGLLLSLTARDEAEADRLFAALAEGGEVQMPLAKTFFSPRFGMVADRFGVSWMIVVDGSTSA